jgi:transaldolase
VWVQNTCSPRQVSIPALLLLIFNCNYIVQPRSLVSPEEVLRLAGVHDITISPAILSDLAITQAADDLSPPFNAEQSRQGNKEKRSFLDDETSFNEALAANTEASRKLKEAISWFLKFEVDMEDMMRTALSQFGV